MATLADLAGQPFCAHTDLMPLPKAPEAKSLFNDERSSLFIGLMIQPLTGIR